jgi:hypothetical protein
MPTDPGPSVSGIPPRRSLRIIYRIPLHVCRVRTVDKRNPPKSAGPGAYDRLAPLELRLALFG